MPVYLRRLAHVSIVELWRKYLSTPSMIPIRLTCPPSLPVVDAIHALFPALTRELIHTYRLQLLRNYSLFMMLDQEMIEVRERRVRLTQSYEFIYLVLRCSRPRLVVETGVFDGLSSTIILQALSDNEAGDLTSIDLPAEQSIHDSTDQMLESSLPPGRQPGWIIPAHLRQRHRLLFGDSKILLPQVLSEYAEVDVFLHDSLHSFEHQLFEYTTAWPHLFDSGLMLSDDIYWSPAFHKFCRDRGRDYVRVGSFGAVRKMPPSEPSLNLGMVQLKGISSPAARKD